MRAHRVARVEVLPYRLELPRPVETGAGRFGHRSGWWVRVVAEDGLVGVGEAAPWPGFVPDVWSRRMGRVERALEGWAAYRGGLRGFTLPADRGAGLAAIDGLLRGGGGPREAAYAIELALLDLLARRLGLSLARLLAPRPAAVLPASPPKLKVGSDLDEAEGRLADLRRSIGPEAPLRIDANGAWRTLDEATRAVERLAPYGPEWIEQPLPAGDLGGLARLRGRVRVPIAVDESLARCGLDPILQAGAADVVVLKPTFVGGLRAAWLLAARASMAGVGVAVSHAWTSPIARTAAGHLWAVLPCEGLAPGLSSPFVTGSIDLSGPGHGALMGEAA